MVGKTRFINTIEKYRRPGQTHKAKVFVCPMYEILYATGVTGVVVESFDGVPWVVCARLTDLIYLAKKNKIKLANVRMYKDEIQIVLPSNESAEAVYVESIKKYNRVLNPIIMSRTTKDMEEHLMRHADYIFSNWLNIGT